MFNSAIRIRGTKQALTFSSPKPYCSAEGVYSNINFTREDHERVKNVAKDVKGKIMISYNDTPEIRSIFKDFVIVPVERMNNMSQRYDAGSVYKEVLIMNYEPKKNPTQIQLEF